MSKNRVVVIEDDEDVVMIFGKLLARLGAEMVSAASGEEGLAAAVRVPPSLILVDLHLQGAMDGLEVLRRIKTTPKLARIPVVVITGNTTVENVRDAARLGASDFLVKANFLEGSGLDRLRTLLTPPGRSRPEPKKRKSPRKRKPPG